MTPPILYEDAEWLVVDKPTGLATHGNEPGDFGLVEWLALHQDRSLFVCSRLDKGTSGVLIFAKNSPASGRAEQIHQSHRAYKKYRLISNRRYKGAKSWQMSKPLAGKECNTSFRLIDEGYGYYCYEATIERGRRHQIRKHAALADIPILGDSHYGGSSFSRLCLHCVELSWPEISVPVRSSQPDSFSLLLAGQSGLVLDGAIAWERRLAWPALVSNSFRLIQRGEIELPLSIDLYDSLLSITVFSESKDAAYFKGKLQPLLDYLATKVDWQGCFLRRHAKNPHQKKLIHDTISWGKVPEKPINAVEQKHSFLVSINDSQHVGLFLDQRDSRRRIHHLARGGRVANLFAFTCSFSVAALAGGAEVVFSVDLAGSSLMRGRENFAANGLDQGGRGKFIKEDVLKWLARQDRKRLKNTADFAYWDLIICDPPVFASAGRGRGFHVEKQWPELVRRIRLLLSDKGVALFANNHRSGKASFYQTELQKHFSSVISLPAPLDFPLLPGQLEHVRIFWCEV